MVDIKKISKGRVTMPPRIVWYSADGVGKTTAVAALPDVFVFDFNHGSEKHDVQRLSVEAWPEFLEWLTAIEKKQVQCGAVGIDSLTELEAMAIKQFAPGGPASVPYQQRDRLLMEFQPVIGTLERIWLQGKPVAITAHAKVKKFSDPTGPSYERFQIAAQDEIAGLFRQWVDFVLFCREEVLVNDKYKGKVTTDHVRWQYTRRTPMFDAKSRGVTPFPERLPLGYASLLQAIEADDKQSSELRAELSAMLAEIGDESLTKQVLDWDRMHADKIVDTHNRIKERLAKKRGSESVEKVSSATVAEGEATKSDEGKAA